MVGAGLEPPGEFGPGAPQTTTKTQRLGLLAGLFLAGCVALYLFSSILLPFVAAACIAYFSIHRRPG